MPCAQHSHITDSRFYRNGYSTDEARAVFCDMRRLQRWLEVEAALAECQGEMGVIPTAAAQELVASAKLDQLDTARIADDIRRTNHSLIPLLSAWQATVSPEAGRFIHFGATTQDIQDTAQILEMRDMADIIERDLLLIIDQLTVLAEEHSDTVIIGRTHGQPALPTTFGLKVAVWLDELIRNHQRLRQCRERLLACQMFGGVGTMAAFGPKADEILRGVATKLGLTAPLCCWHTSRDRLVEILNVAAMIGGCLGKIANEICQLSRFEIGELEEPFHMGKIGSSTMPHKRNPEMCEQVVVLARLVRTHAGTAGETLISEHERDYRAVRLEWATLTDGLLYLAGALSMMRFITGNLRVHAERMRSNAVNVADLIGTEALMFELGKQTGKQTAHQLIYEAAMQAVEENTPLLDLLNDCPEIQKHFTRDDLARMIAPERHIGRAKELTATTVAAARATTSKARETQYAPASCPLAASNGCCAIPTETIA